VKVHYGEGVANRFGPEPCAGSREGAGEASVSRLTLAYNDAVKFARLPSLLNRGRGLRPRY